VRSSRTTVTRTDEYDEQDDLYKSVEFAYKHIRERVAKGGKKWKGYMTWQPISTAPKDTLVLVYDPTGCNIAYLDDATHLWIACAGNSHDEIIVPTHWQSLPEPPK
jgi:hypothetical protein